jgi:hypothetical protein
MRVTVDEAGDGREAVPVDLLHVAGKRGQVAHRADGLDHAVAAEDEGVLDQLDLPQRAPAQRCLRPGW